MIALAVWGGAWFSGRNDEPAPTRSPALDTGMNDKPQLNPMLKLALDLGPLLLFFFANAKPALFEPWIAPLIPAAVATGERAGIFVATAVFMVAILAALVISYVLTRRLPMMAVVSAVIVVVFGGATLIFQNETFIKLKPTIIYLLFTGTLFGGLIFRKPLLAIVFDQMFHLTDEGWRKLTIRWALFFLGLAILNEIVWRTQTTDTWVTFKVFGVMPLTFIFAALQYPLLMKHEASSKKNSPPAKRAIGIFRRSVVLLFEYRRETLPPFAASFCMTCLCSQMFIDAELLVSPE